MNVEIHNPEGVPHFNVPSGWRLLYKHEVDGRFENKARLLFRDGVWSKDATGVSADCKDATYIIKTQRKKPCKHSRKEVWPWEHSSERTLFHCLSCNEVWSEKVRFVDNGHSIEPEDMTFSEIVVAAHSQKPTTITKREEILQKAIQCVTVDRQATHGKPENSFADIAHLWSWWKGVEFTQHDVAVMMGLMKTARIKANPDHEDSYVDNCGYSSLAAELKPQLQ
jgi:hypothetical protein